MIKDRQQLACAQFMDEEIASMVRMLMRDQVDHEMVCIAARDRILWLRDQLGAADAENARLRAKLEAAPHAFECTNWQNGGPCDCWKAAL